MKQFVTVLWFLKLIDELINKPTLEPEYQELITSFKNEYYDLKQKFGLTIPNKIQIIIDHLPSYLKRTKTTIIHTTDQTI